MDKIWWELRESHRMTNKNIMNKDLIIIVQHQECHVWQIWVLHKNPLLLLLLLIISIKNVLLKTTFLSTEHSKLILHEKIIVFRQWLSTYDWIWINVFFILRSAMRRLLYYRSWQLVECHIMDPTWSYCLHTQNIGENGCEFWRMYTQSMTEEWSPEWSAFYLNDH